MWSVCTCITSFIFVPADVTATLYYDLQIQAGAGALIAGANLFVFGTIYSFFVFFARDDEWDWTTF